MPSHRFDKQPRSTITSDLINLRLQPVPIVLGGPPSTHVRQRNNAGVYLSVHKDESGFLISTPDEARAAGLTMLRNDQINFARNRDGIRENNLSPGWRHISDPAVNCEAWMPVFDKAAEKRFSALDLPTLDHLSLSHRALPKEPKPSVGTSFDEELSSTGLYAVSINILQSLLNNYRAVA